MALMMELTLHSTAPIVPYTVHVCAHPLATCPPSYSQQHAWFAAGSTRRQVWHGARHVRGLLTFVQLAELLIRHPLWLRLNTVAGKMFCKR